MLIFNILDLFHNFIGTKISDSVERKKILATLVCKILSHNKFI